MSQVPDRYLWKRYHTCLCDSSRLSKTAKKNVTTGSYCLATEKTLRCSLPVSHFEHSGLLTERGGGLIQTSLVEVSKITNITYSTLMLKKITPTIHTSSLKQMFIIKPIIQITDTSPSTTSGYRDESYWILNTEAEGCILKDWQEVYYWFSDGDVIHSVLMS